MTSLSPQQIADKWANNTGAGSNNYVAGIRGFQGNPMAMAAAAAQQYLQGVQNAVSSGKWAASLNAQPASYWQNQAITKGAPRLASGANAAKPKFQAFMSRFLPVLAANVAQVRAMPKGGLANGIARMTQMATLNAQFKNQ